MEPILKVKDISVDFETKRGKLRAVDNVSLDIYKGEIIGVIGESGSGKSTLASAILNLVTSPGKISSGKVAYIAGEGKETFLNELSSEELNKYRWTNIATVFQAAQNALNPVLKIKEHVLETVLAHEPNRNYDEIINKAKEVFKYVRLDEKVLDCYPHQLSGGMKQRTIIALSLLLDPEVIILDEPTTALDVITQWYIIDILRKIHTEFGVTMIFLTHDVSIIASVVDRIVVMYAGQVVEYGDVYTIFSKPSHPYTYGIINAIPSLFDEVKTRKAIPGAPPNLIGISKDCRFGERCMFKVKGKCMGTYGNSNKLIEVEKGQFSRCSMWKEVVKL
ncbi:ABC transporter ATP-binding protein [Clostridium sp.]|uniref:ABC transporter ATP-binding protein n=1 Tax=Clostridium sp. TaxID=1506 RepID=UPI002609D108|nr:ABC transporter ATP-binding protein [Clostridium sp.]